MSKVESNPGIPDLHATGQNSGTDIGIVTNNVLDQLFDRSGTWFTADGGSSGLSPEPAEERHQNKHD